MPDYMSPRRRSRSRSYSRRRSYSPRRRSYSPRKRSYSPRRRSPSPYGRGGRYPPRRSAGFRRRSPDRGTEVDRNESTNLYVGNIPYTFTERDVEDLFERCGRLKSIHVPMDRVTGRNKGFTFVDFEDRRDAEDAYNKYNGYTIEGRRLRIDWDIGLNKKETRRQHDPPRRSFPEDRNYPSPIHGERPERFSPDYRRPPRSPSPYRR